MPICKECGRDLAETEFHRQGQGKKKSICKYCTNARNVKYREKYRERDKAKGKIKPKSKRNPIVMIPSWPEQIKLGEDLTVEWDIDKRGKTIRRSKFSGTVIYLDNTKIVLKGKNYTKSLDRIDLLINKARLV